MRVRVSLVKRVWQYRTFLSTSFLCSSLEDSTSITRVSPCGVSVMIRESLRHSQVFPMAIVSVMVPLRIRVAKHQPMDCYRFYWGWGYCSCVIELIGILYQVARLMVHCLWNVVLVTDMVCWWSEEWMQVSHILRLIFDLWSYSDRMVPDVCILIAFFFIYRAIGFLALYMRAKFQKSGA